MYFLDRIYKVYYQKFEQSCWQQIQAENVPTMTISVYLNNYKTVAFMT